MGTFNIYCDESCHLENDRQQVMIIGAVWCPQDQSRSIAKRIKAIKKKHGLSPTFEIKWIKVSPAKIDFYMDLINYFFEEKELYFRAVIIPDKTKLCHDAFDHDHDTWYYKMYFEMLKVLLYPYDRYRIYLDIKDSRSGTKVSNLHNILSNNTYDFQRQIIERIQHVRSHEVEQVQLADLLIGCVLAANRDQVMSTTKQALVEKLRQLSKYCLTRTTLMRERKMNLLRWQAREVNNGG
ncbi:MAG: DUF3800 domain-containing protein [Verrucomicrobia bacterium]|nr:DUF3800 domain-containing protein [Verrucomicrobiota bacterium]